MKKLPIGIQNLREIIEEGYLYVDKTEHIWQLASTGKNWFLSRPRRFGKSLLVDTLKELFEGNQLLFKGLFIDKKWDWGKCYPVIKIDFAEGVIQSRSELNEKIVELLDDNQQRLGIKCKKKSLTGCFSDLIRMSHAKYGQGVVILIDEYDKPILDNIDKPEQAAEIREGLKNIYSVMKARDAEIQFIFMTGVTKFSKVSLFSGLNQLNDITLDPEYGEICGYTQRDLETSFAEHLQGVDWPRLKAMYNGYRFLGKPVYNPFDILLFIQKGLQYRNYWFESGSPSFLLKLFRQHSYFLPNLEQTEVGEELLNSFEIEKINPVTLLFQSGYLTIVKQRERFGIQLYTLTIPNQEVRQALNTQLIDTYAEIDSQRMSLQNRLFDTLCNVDMTGLITTIKRLFAAIPWRNFTNNRLPESEGYYASVLYAFFASLNATIIPEDITNHGQVDLTIIIEERIYCIEIKLERDTPPTEPRDINSALQQIIDKGYSEKYLNKNAKALFEVGLVFNSQARNLVQADWRQRI